MPYMSHRHCKRRTSIRKGVHYNAFKAGLLVISTKEKRFSADKY